MSSRSSQTPRRRNAATRKLNRAEQRALEVRRAETRRTADEEPVELVAPKTRETTVNVRQSRRRNVPVGSPRVNLLSRTEEYAIIRADFRRLLITAGALLAVMLLLLVVIE